MGYLWSQALFVLLIFTFNALYAQAQTDSATTNSTSANGNGNGSADSEASANRDPNVLALQAPSQIVFCSTVDLTWTGGSPSYEVFYARGTGAIGDESALGAEQWLGAAQDLKFSWHVTSEWTIPGDTIKLRVQDKQGRGVNGTAWAAVVAGNDMSCGNPTSVGPTGTDHHSSFIVSAPPHDSTRGSIDDLPGSSDSPGPTDTHASVTNGGDIVTASGTNNNAQPPATTLTAASLPFPTGDESGGNDQSGNRQEGSNSDPSNPSDSSGSGDTSGGGSPVLNNDDSPAHTGNVNGSGSSSDVPTNASSHDTTATKNVSSSTVGAIIGSMIGALIVIVAFLFWRRWKQQKTAHLRLDDGYDRPMSEAEAGRASHYSPFSMVTPNPPSRGNSGRSNPYSQHSHSHSHSHSPSHQVITPEPGSGPFADDASLVSYNAAVGPGVYSPLDTPDPFRSTTFQGQVPFLNLNQNQSQHQIDSTPHAL